MKNYLLLALAFIFNAVMFGQQGKVRLGLDFGYSYRVAKLGSNIPSDLEAYAKELKSGTTLDFNLGYNVKENWGLGLTFSQFNSEGSITSDNFNLFDAFGNRIRSTSDDIKITFIAPEFYSMISIGGSDKHMFVSGVAIGYLGFENNSTIGSNSFSLKGGSLGLGIDLGYEYKITSVISIGVNAGLISGSISEFKVSAEGRQSETISVEDATGGAQERENLSRINLTAGLKFYL